MSTHPTGIFLFFSKQLQAFIISLEKEIETFQIFLQWSTKHFLILLDRMGLYL